MVPSHSLAMIFAIILFLIYYKSMQVESAIVKVTNEN